MKRRDVIKAISLTAAGTALAASDQQFPQVQEVILKNWRTHKTELVNWMDAQMGEVSEMGRKSNKPVGNTEGWGLINWLDHPP